MFHSFPKDFQYPIGGFETNNSNYDDDQQPLPITSKANLIKNNLFLISPGGGNWPITGRSRTNLVLVLDLDETAVHSYSNGLADYQRLGIEKMPDLRSRTYLLTLNDVVTPHGQGEVNKIWGIERPHLNEFLIFCFSYFRMVIVWSAGQYKYVHAIVDTIFANILPPHHVMTWDDCIKVDGICDKDLNIIYRHPELGAYANPSNTLIIDDREHSFQRNTPENGILIPPYNPDLRIDSLRSDDIAFLQLQAWLQRPEVINSTDVRKLNKKGIFRSSISKLTGSKKKVRWDDGSISHSQIQEVKA
jgi:hypothetical protein